jgi:hypothetical protein
MGEFMSKSPGIHSSLRIRIFCVILYFLWMSGASKWFTILLVVSPSQFTKCLKIFNYYNVCPVDTLGVVQKAIATTDNDPS